MTTIKKIRMEEIRIDGGTQMRVTLSTDTVEKYAEILHDGGTLPPPTVYWDGTSYWLSDGFHRRAAHVDVGAAAIDCEVREGTRRDAILHSLSANAAHGLQRSNSDKRKAVIYALRDPELSKLSQHDIAKLCGVTQAMVSKVNKELGDNRYQTPAQVLEVLTGDLRSKFVALMMRGGNYVEDPKQKKLFVQMGLHNDYGSHSEWTPLAKSVFEEILKADRWMRIERDILLEAKKKEQYLHVYTFGVVKAALEAMLEKHANQQWLNSNVVGHEKLTWLKILALTGYATEHKTGGDNWKYNKTFYWITPAGCKLLELPYSIPQKPAPTIQDLIAEEDQRRAVNPFKVNDRVTVKDDPVVGHVTAIDGEKVCVTKRAPGAASNQTNWVHYSNVTLVVDTDVVERRELQMGDEVITRAGHRGTIVEPVNGALISVKTQNGTSQHHSETLRLAEDEDEDGFSTGATSEVFDEEDEIDAEDALYGEEAAIEDPFAAGLEDWLLDVFENPTVHTIAPSLAIVMACADGHPAIVSIDEFRTHIQKLKTFLDELTP